MCVVFILETLSVRVAPTENLKGSSSSSLFSSDDLVHFRWVSHNVEKPSVVCACAQSHALCVCVCESTSACMCVHSHMLCVCVHFCACVHLCLCVCR